MDNYNYPPGSDVSWAPWNQKDPEYEKCTKCDGVGKIGWYDEGEGVGGYDECEICKGTGLIEIENEK